jgi:chromosomal replication initiation ATPase DnaA
LEEVRHILAEAWKKYYSDEDGSIVEHPNAFQLEHEYQDSGKLKLSQKEPFSEVRVSTLVGIVPCSESMEVDATPDDLIQAITHPATLDKEQRKKTFNFVSQPGASLLKEEKRFCVYPLESILSHSRQLLTGVIAAQTSQLRLTLDHSDSRKDKQNDFQSVSHTDSDNNPDAGTFRFVELNPSQERAAKEFLDSPADHITLVQGPPGTGKTHFIVAAIIRFLQGNRQPKLSVCARTNKAASVLTLKFLQAARGNDSLLISLIGDENKIFG